MLKYLVSLLSAFALVFVFAAPANAGVHYAYQGKDWARVNGDHTAIQVHDVECDGRQVFVRYDKVGSPGVYSNWYDQNGCGDGGTSYPFPDVYWIRVCEYISNNDYICGPIVDTTN